MLVDIPECSEIEKALKASKSHDRSSSTQSRNSRKRQSDEEFSGRSKNAQVESEPKPRPFRQQVADDKFNLLTDLRCALTTLPSDFLRHGMSSIVW